MYGATISPLHGSYIIKLLLLITFLIYFKVDFNPSFLISDINLVTYEKFLGSGMMCDTSKPDYPKMGNELFN